MSAALDLLDQAEAELRALAGDLQGDARYRALLSANAVATARRGIALAGRLTRAEAALGTDAAAIRAGRHDDDAAVHARLLELAGLRAFVSDPAALPAQTRAAIERTLDES